MRPHVCVCHVRARHVPGVPWATAEGPRDHLVSAPAILTSALGSVLPVFLVHPGLASL